MLATSSQYWDGRIDDMRIYNRALTDAEIRLDYDHPFNIFQLRDPVVGFVAAVAPAAVPFRTLMGVGTKIIEKDKYPCDEAYCY